MSVYTSPVSGILSWWPEWLRHQTSDWSLLSKADFPGLTSAGSNSSRLPEHSRQLSLHLLVIHLAHTPAVQVKNGEPPAMAKGPVFLWSRTKFHQQGSPCGNPLPSWSAKPPPQHENPRQPGAVWTLMTNIWMFLWTSDLSPQLKRDIAWWVWEISAWPRIEEAQTQRGWRSGWSPLQRG